MTTKVRQICILCSPLSLLLLTFDTMSAATQGRVLSRTSSAVSSSSTPLEGADGNAPAWELELREQVRGNGRQLISELENELARNVDASPTREAELRRKFEKDKCQLEVELYHSFLFELERGRAERRHEVPPRNATNGSPVSSAQVGNSDADRLAEADRRLVAAGIKEAELTEREDVLNQRRQRLARRVQDVKQREKYVAARELQLTDQETQLAEYVREHEDRVADVAARTRDLDAQQSAVRMQVEHLRKQDQAFRLLEAELQMRESHLAAREQARVRSQAEQVLLAQSQKAMFAARREQQQRNSRQSLLLGVVQGDGGVDDVACPSNSGGASELSSVSCSRGSRDVPRAAAFANTNAAEGSSGFSSILSAMATMALPSRVSREQSSKLRHEVVQSPVQTPIRISDSHDPADDIPRELSRLTHGMGPSLCHDRHNNNDGGRHDVREAHLDCVSQTMNVERMQRKLSGRQNNWKVGEISGGSTLQPDVNKSMGVGEASLSHTAHASQRQSAWMNPRRRNSSSTTEQCVSNVRPPPQVVRSASTCSIQEITAEDVHGLGREHSGIGAGNDHTPRRGAHTVARKCGRRYSYE
ncbi:hypothetical protein FISHEDRAFT_57430 [Fistulina hepatica ATCC 64428]|uniref:Uncharacterized protein n=1 Tax=Fistulina hepatica ATCC 64428 TaxID=1128425 RepID=A0A0D7AHI8_9AGAR|nr:hypothetical protein FISHEDRAFT_57430 [Fistulina hepatica ATCC 64428]